MEAMAFGSLEKKFHALQQASRMSSSLSKTVMASLLAQAGPDVLDRVQFRGAGRQRQEGDVVGHDEVPCPVPSRPVEVRRIRK
jgi:hypothetical protein